MTKIRFAIKVFEERYGKDFLSGRGNIDVRTIFYTILRELYGVTDREISDYFHKNRGQLTKERNRINILLKHYPLARMEYSVVKSMIKEEEELPVWIIEN